MGPIVPVGWREWNCVSSRRYKERGYGGRHLAQLGKSPMFRAFAYVTHLASRQVAQTTSWATLLKDRAIIPVFLLAEFYENAAMVTRPPFFCGVQSISAQPVLQGLGSEDKIKLAGRRLGACSCRPKGGYRRANARQFRGPWIRRPSALWRIGTDERQSESLHAAENGVVPRLPVLTPSLSVSTEHIKVAGSDDLVPALPSDEYRKVGDETMD